MSEQQIYEILKNVSLIDIFSLIAKRNNIQSNIENVEVYYTAKELYELYPNIFSKYKLDKYIKEENFPVIKHGKDRLFKKALVEDWLQRRSENQYKRMT